MTRFWLALDCLVDQAAVPRVWRDYLMDEYRDDHPFLQTDGALASSYSHYHAPSRGFREFEVICHGPEDWVGVGEDGERLPLAREDLLVHRLNEPALVAALRRVFGLDAPPNAERPLPGMVPVGTLRPFAGVEGSVYLLLSSSPSECLARLEALARRDDSDFLLLTPARRFGRFEWDRLSRPHPITHLCLADTVRPVEGRRLELTEVGSARLRGYTERITPSPMANPDFFPTPPHARWSDLVVRFLDGHSVHVSVGAVSRVLNYTQLGMNNERTGKPSVQWELLRSLAKNAGQLTWASRDATSANKKRKQLLADQLKRFFRIDGEPIEYEKRYGYQTVFRLEEDG